MFLYSSDVLMCKQVILTILIVSVAFGTISEFQFRVIQLGPAAYSTTVSRHPSVRLCTVVIWLSSLHLLFELPPSLLLLRRNLCVFSSKNKKIKNSEAIQPPQKRSPGSWNMFPRMTGETPEQRSRRRIPHQTMPATLPSPE